MSAMRRPRGAGARALGLALLAAAVLAGVSVLVGSRDGASELGVALAPAAPADAAGGAGLAAAEPTAAGIERALAEPVAPAPPAAPAGVPPVRPALGLADLPALRARDAAQGEYLEAWRAAALLAPAELARLAPGVVADPATSTKERVALLRVAWDARRELAHELLRAVLLAPPGTSDAAAVEFAVRRLTRAAATDPLARATLTETVWPARKGLDAGLRRRAAAAVCAAAEPAELERLRGWLAAERDEVLREACLAALEANGRVAGR